MVAPAELKKREHENKMGGNWGEQELWSSLSFFLFPAANFSRAFYFRFLPTIREPGTG